MTDRNGTQDDYGFDGLSRQVSDTATVLGTGFGVRRLAVAFQNAKGRVRRRMGRFEKRWQATTLQNRTTAYSSTGVLTYSYGDSGGTDDAINRREAIVDGYGTAAGATTSDTLAAYGYLGVGTIVTENYEQPQIELNYAGSTPGSYPGLDQFDRVQDQFWASYAGGTTTPLDEYDYGYNLQGDVAYRQNVVAGAADLDQAYTDDDQGQLTSLSQGQVNTATDQIMAGTENFYQSWTPDGNGNWTAFQQCTTASNLTLNQQRTPSPTNAISSITNTVGAAWVQPQYDGGLPGPGNMTITPQPDNQTAGLTCTYDAWNRLVNVSNGGSINVSYAYDGLGRLITRTDNNAGAGAVATTDYYYAGQQLLESIDRSPLPLGEGQGEGSPANDATMLDEQYVWSARYVDSPIESDSTVSTYTTGSGWTAATDRLYYLTDANDNVTAVTNAAGAVQERYAYDAYGDVTIYNSTWTATSAASTVGNTVFFAGMRQDPATGLYHDHARWYNPATGGFLSRDPAQSSPNLYEYAGNDPTGAVDPTGLVTISPPHGPWTAPGRPAVPAKPNVTVQQRRLSIQLQGQVSSSVINQFQGQYGSSVDLVLAGCGKPQRVVVSVPWLGKSYTYDWVDCWFTPGYYQLEGIQTEANAGQTVAGIRAENLRDLHGEIAYGEGFGFFARW